MKVLPYLGRVLPAAALTLLAAGVTAQPLPRTSMNKASAGHAFTLGTAPVKQPGGVVGGSCAPDGLCLAVTLALADPGDPNLCGTATDLAVDIGDEVDICYTVTNQSATTLNYHTLVDDHVGQLLTNSNVVLAPGATYRYHRVIVASASPGHDNGTFTSTWTASDGLAGYSANASAPYAFVDVSASGTALSLSDDGAAAITMPFAFAFYGTASSNLCIGNNGGLYFGLSSCSAFPYNNTALPSSGLNNPAILPYWDDMLPNGTIYYATLGSAPNRQFVVEYKNKFSYGDSGDPTGQTGATFEVILDEADGSIDFEYQTTSFGGAGAGYDNGVSATVGLQSNGSFANQYSYNSASLHDGLAIAWTPANPTSYSATAAATLDVGTPTMITTPNAATGFTPSVPAGSSTSAPLSIDNIGNRDLVWSMTPPAANAHFPKTPRTSVPFHGPWDGVGVSPDGVRRASKSKVHSPAGTMQVPVYATQVTVNGADYVSFDAAAPSTSNVILADSPPLFGITFVDNDFSKQYGVDYFEGKLYTISTLDGSTTVVGSTGLVSCCIVEPGGMRWDPTSGTTYLVIDDFRSASRSSTLYTIDLATAATTLVGTLGGMIRDITFDRSGLMYGIDSDGDTLVAIDKTNAATQVIGSLGFDAVFGQGLDFDAETGVLYLASADETSRVMYTVDPLTGAATAISDMASEVDSMAIAKSGAACATPADTPWLGYDIPGGTVTPDPEQAHPATVNVSFDAAGLAPGDYDANLCVYSNDLSHSRVAIPVHLTVGPAQPVDTIFADGFDGAGGGGATTLAQTTASTPIAQNSAACGDSASGTTADNQYWRRYYFSEYALTSPVHVSSVDVSVEQTNGAPGVTVTLYTIPHGVAVDTIDTAQLTQVGQAATTAPAGSTLTSINVPVSGTVADTVANDLVVEVSTEDGSGDGTAFYIGSTTAAETHPSFLSSTACGLAAPATTASIGFPGMHVIQAVNIDG